MALIGKLREKSGWAIGIVAAGLGLFIVGGDILSPTSVLRGNNKQTVGEIAGKEITFKDFQAEIDELRYSYYINTNKVPEGDALEQIRQQAWSQLVFKIAFQKEYDALGLEVGKEEVVDMVQGKNIHPVIQQSLRNPQTGQFDRNFVIYYLQNLGRMDQKQQAMWFNFEKSLAPERLRNKYENMLKLTNYVTQAEAAREYRAQNERADINYALISYSTIPDNELGLTENDIEDYINKNEHRFNTEASVNLQYVTFPIIPTAADSADFNQDVQEMIADFKTTDDDSLFVAVNADKPTVPRWMNPGELPTALQKLSTLEKNIVYGPYIEEGKTTVYKVGGIIDDTLYAAKASHILIRWDSNTEADKKKALEKAKEILAKIKKGQETFEDMAREYGTDGTSTQGGDLGWFNQGRMVPEFEKAVFAAKQKGLLPEPVETQFGYHLIKITETKTNKKYYIATIDRSIAPGDATRDSVYKKAESFALAAADATGFGMEAQKNGYQALSAPNVLSSSPYINNLFNPKEILRWAFEDAKEESISPVFELDNQYVVAVLNNRYKHGKVNIESNKQMVAYTVATEKRAKMIIEKIGEDTRNIDQALKAAGSNDIKMAFGVSLSNPILQEAGFEPDAVGASLGLPENQSSRPLKGNAGVIVVKTLKKYPAGEIADYSAYKSAVLNNTASRNEYNITQAIVDKAKIKDTRYRFY